MRRTTRGPTVSEAASVIGSPAPLSPGTSCADEPVGALASAPDAGPTPGASPRGWRRAAALRASRSRRWSSGVLMGLILLHRMARGRELLANLVGGPPRRIVADGDGALV